MIYPKVSIIILNWNGWKDTIECLESLNRINYPNFDVVIVDNDSKNDSIEKIREYCKGNIKVESDFVKYDPLNKPIEILEYEREESKKAVTRNDFLELPSNRKITLIKSEMNSGFPEGCNIGMRYALRHGFEHLLLLNNDTVVDPDFLNELVDVAESDGNIGILGSKILFYQRPNIMQAAGGRIIWNLGYIGTYNGEDKGQYDEIVERDYVYGTSLLLKKEVIDKISFMDSSFFFGVEEYDYCTKAKRAGFKIVYVPGSKVWHKVGASSKNISKHPETLKYIEKTGGYNYHKYLYKLFKRHGPPVLFIIPFLFNVFYRTFIQNLLMLTTSFITLLSRGETDKIKDGIKKRLS